MYEVKAALNFYNNEYQHMYRVSYTYTSFKMFYGEQLYRTVVLLLATRRSMPRNES